MKTNDRLMFDEPTMTFIVFASEDIITTSGDGSGIPGLETPDIPVP